MQLSEQGEKLGRRSFLGYVIAAAGAFVTTVLGTSSAIFAASPLLTQRRGAQVSLGQVTEFKVGMPKMVEFSLPRKDGSVVEDAAKSVWVVRTGEDKFITYSPRCTPLDASSPGGPSSRRSTAPAMVASSRLRGR